MCYVRSSSAESFDICSAVSLRGWLRLLRAGWFKLVLVRLVHNIVLIKSSFASLQHLILPFHTYNFKLTTNMTTDIESSQVLSQNVTRVQQEDGSWAVTTSTVYSDGTKKDVTQIIQSSPDAAFSTKQAPPATGASAVYGASTPPVQSSAAVPMGNSAPQKVILPVNGKAQASMWCGIVGLFIFGLVLGPIAICLGVQAKIEIAQNPDKMDGKCQATAGISCGCVALLLWLIIIIIFASMINWNWFFGLFR